MQQVMAYGTAIMTVGLVLSLPRTAIGARFGPAAAAALGVAVMLALGVLSLADLAGGMETLWRPFVAVLSIMLTASVAERFGVLGYFTGLLQPHAAQPVARTFAAVFVLSVVTSAVLNNDAAVLLLTPLVVDLVRRCYPARPDLIQPFAFAVFAAAGVAPLVISNPMNLIVADLAGIGFNQYAMQMIPIAVLGWITAFAVLRILFRRELRSHAAAVQRLAPVALTAPGKQFLVLMLASLASYPVLTWLNGPVWGVAAGTAALGMALALHHGAARPRDLARAISWETLAFLFCVFVMAIGLRNVGFVDLVAGFYASVADPAGKVALIGVSSALGSALLNNHPMAIINALAIGGVPGPKQYLIFAALIGGDLGPRLLPMGSLAALLWLDSLRRQDVHVTTSRFVMVGIPLTAATLAVSLLLLAAMSQR